jgi:hypothetical protein
MSLRKAPLNENGLDWNRRDRNRLGWGRLNAPLRINDNDAAQCAAGTDGAMSQGIADEREKQGEMRDGARDLIPARMFFSERDASGPRKGLQAPLSQT